MPKPTTNYRSSLGQAQAVLLQAAADAAPVAELARAAETYRDAYVISCRRYAMRAMGRALSAVADAINVRTNLTTVTLELHVTAHTDGFTPSLRKRIKKAGGSYSECRGHSSTRYVKIPARSVDLADVLFKACVTDTIIVRAPTAVWDALTKTLGAKHRLSDQVHMSRNGRDGKRQKLQAPSVHVQKFVELLEGAAR